MFEYKTLSVSWHSLVGSEMSVEDLVKDVHDRDIWSKVNLLADELDPIVSALEPVGLDPKKLAIKALALSGHNLDTARARVEDIVKDVHDRDIWSKVNLFPEYTSDIASDLKPVELDPKKLAIKALALSGHNHDTARARVEDLVNDVTDRDIWAKVNLLP